MKFNQMGLSEDKDVLEEESLTILTTWGRVLRRMEHGLGLPIP